MDSWPKTLPMMSVGSWNSTTETHLLYVLVVHETFLMLWKEYFLLSWDIIFLLGLWPFSLYHCRSFFLCAYDFRVYWWWLFEISDEMTLQNDKFYLLSDHLFDWCRLTVWVSNNSVFSRILLKCFVLNTLWSIAKQFLRSVLEKFLKPNSLQISWPSFSVIIFSQT